MNHFTKVIFTGLISFSLHTSLYAAETLTTMQSTSPTAEATSPAVQNKIQGEAFLKENKKHKDVVTLPSGLQYKIVREGHGESPKATDSVTVHYAGTLINGKEFDSSYKRHEPATFPVSGVIAGWTEALKLMKPGAEWMIYIPSDLAYGERGASGAIGPNEVLIFKVELLSVNKQ